MPPQDTPSVVMVARLFPPEYSGAGLQAARLAARLARRGARVEVLTLARGTLRTRRDRLDSVPVTRAPGLGASAQLQRAALWLALLRRCLDPRRRCDVVHLHGYPAFLPWLKDLKRMAGFRVLFKPTMMGSDDPLSVRSNFGRRGLEAVDQWVCTTAELEDSALRAGIPRDRVRRIPNAVDLARFEAAGAGDRDAVREELGVAADARVWVTVGAVVPRKRTRLLVEAWPFVGEAADELWVVGPDTFDDDGQLLDGRGPYALALHRRAQELGIQPAVRFLGAREDVPRLLAAADGFLFASAREGSPNAVIEALAAGLPVVATAFPSSEELQALAPGRIRVVAPEPRAIAAGVAAAPTDRRRPPGLDAYGLDEVAARYLELYGRL